MAKEIDITFSNWMNYRRVQDKGRYNMITEAAQAMRAASLTREEYFYIIENFSSLMDKFEPKNK